MELKQLTFFLTCAECGSLGKTSEVLYTSQPNVSKVIRSLEDELGAPLFERTRHGMYLTAYGKAVYQYARSIAQDVDVIKALRPERWADSLCVSSYRSHTLARMLSEICEKKPELLITYRQGTVEEIIAQVEEGASEFGILYVAQRHAPAFRNLLHRKRMSFCLLGHLDTCIYAGPKNPFYNKESITFEELSQLRFIRDLDDVFSIQDGLEHIELGVVNPDQLRAAVYTNSAHFSNDLLATTDIAALGIHLDFPDEDNEIHAVMIDGENSQAALGVVTLQGHSFSPQAQSCIRTLCDTFHFTMQV